MSVAFDISPPSRTWSPQQEAVFGAVESGSGHLIVEALAGTGKTTTIIESLYRTPEGSPVILLAFNRIIAEELGRRAPDDVETATLNSFGFRALRKKFPAIKIDANASMLFAKKLLGDHRNSWETRKAVTRIVSAAKATLSKTPPQLDLLIDSLGIDLPDEADASREECIDAAREILYETVRCAGAAPADYDDQIFLPIALNLPITRYAFLFVDETQDLNAAQLELIQRAGSAGRIIAIGDRRQGIYGFRGADRAAIPRMIRSLNATVLPLSTTYRCPKSVVREAQRIVPAFNAAPSAPEGIVRWASEEELFDAARPGDFVISRTNAPLMSLALRWIASGKRAAIRGRDIGGGLIQWIKKTKAQDVPLLLKALAQWEEREVSRLEAEERDTDLVKDKAACIRALARGTRTVQELIEKCDAVFADSLEGNDTIVLTSTHRAKGLEANRVWLLRGTYLRRGPKSSEEEFNLLYVGITRSKQELIYVKGDEE